MDSSAAGLHAGEADLWDSGRVEATDGLLIPYAGAPLRSRQRAFWTVQVWDDEGEAAAPEEPAWFEMGLLDEGEWQARWMTQPGDRLPEEAERVTYFSHPLTVDGPVLRARAYITALGLYELRANDQRAGDRRLAPGWTDYTKRLQYQVLDLTDLLSAGDNTIEVVLADGWYAGWIGWLGGREHYGSTPQLLIRIEVETAAGTTVLVSDDTWLAGDGPIRRSDMLMGEHVDLGFEPTGAPLAARLTDGGGSGNGPTLVTSPAPPVRVVRRVTPVSVTQTAEDVHRIDLGQNLVGWLRLRLGGPAGTEVTVHHAEMCDADGAPYTENLRSAKAVDSYTLSGARPSWCEPSFTFHGFRYAEVRGYRGRLTAADVTASVLASDVEPTGSFACSDPRVNQLHENIVWGARGNFVEVPTDCPQRDERLGWMGDAQVFVETGCYLFDMAGFFTKWLDDVIDAQSPEGGFPDVAPRIVDLGDGNPAWADAGVIVPWVVARRYGDERLLAHCYPAMRRWIEHLREANPKLLWLEHRSYDIGDWLNIDAQTDKDLLATAFWAESTRLTARTADALGHADEARDLHELADGITTAFGAAFVLPDGSLSSPTQTAYALALRFGLIPTGLRQTATGHLVADIDERGHITTGFVGVNHLLPALTANGRSDVAYRLLLHDGYPSWLYSVRHGATTIWERWDGWTDNRGFQAPGMNSFNHYAFGAVGEWLYRSVAGIGIDESALSPRRIVIAPEIEAGLDWVDASYESPLGRVACAWRRPTDGAPTTVAVNVPVGAEATVRLPAPSPEHITEGGRPIQDSPDIALIDETGTHVTLGLGAGRFEFACAGVGLG